MAIIGLKFDWDMWKDFWLSHWRKVKSFFSHLSHLHHHGVNPNRRGGVLQQVRDNPPIPCSVDQATKKSVNDFYD